MTPRIMQIITRIYRLPGSQTLWRVALACEHRPSVTGAELKRQQLFVGKAVVCAESGRKEN